MSETVHGPSASGSERSTLSKPIRVLIVDDEERLRDNLTKRLSLRGFNAKAVADGQEAIRLVRRGRPDVVVLDRKMPGMDGEEVLSEIKRISPFTQVIMLTGHATLESATETGRLKAFAYLEKPCETDVLVTTIESAAQERVYAEARSDMTRVESRSVRGWLWGTHNFRPGIIALGALVLLTVWLSPVPEGLVELMSAEKTGDLSVDRAAGFAAYGSLGIGETIADYYSHYADRSVSEAGADGQVLERALNGQEAGRAGLIMVGILVICAMFWATGALPIGITALLAGVLMYFFNIFPPDTVAKAYAKDAVIFIMGVLALALGITKTGLDRRIGLVLLSTSKSIPRFLFLFLPLLGVTAAFLSEHALIAFIAPILMVVYMGAVRVAGIAKDKSLAVLLILGVCFAANQGGPGSPAAGGRNAVMVGILADYGYAPSFGEWVKYGLPFVPVMALVIAAYFFFFLYRKTKIRHLNIAEIVRDESEKIGKMTTQEWLALGVLALVVILWVTSSTSLGMGGPVLLGLVLLAIFRIINWRDINKISWDVVALYASACAMGVGLAKTGAGLWIAESFLNILPDALSHGEGLCVAASLITGVLTNFMSDGATVSAVGPITVPMAAVSGTHPWAVGFATAFASSFANMLIIGTPNNAIAFSLAKDLRTGEQLVGLSDFLKHGVVITVLALLVLWGWAFFGYWQWIGF